MHTFFMTGTDTEIGKTFACCELLRAFASTGYRSAGMKPVASGAELINGEWKNDDALQLQRASNVELPYEIVNPYLFKPAIAPHIAAQLAGRSIDKKPIEQAAGQINADILLVEGVGGWAVPLGPKLMLADLIKPLTRKVILVVGLRLGCINHALLSAQSIRAMGFELCGWVANCIDPQMACQEQNIAAIEARIATPRLATLPWSDAPDKDVANSWDLAPLLKLG